jgi:hypothetical protein
MEHLVQITGALLILVAFVAAQYGMLRPDSTRYLVLNLAGSAVLTVDAWVGRQWGFFLLEGVWAIVSLAGLGRALRGRRPAAPDKDVPG